MLSEVVDERFGEHQKSSLFSRFFGEEKQEKVLKFSPNRNRKFDIYLQKKLTLSTIYDDERNSTRFFA